MTRISFYYKPGCWFCDQAEEMLNGYRERYNLKINRVDITQNKDLYELYRFDIPVIKFEDGTTLHGRIKKRDFIRKLKEKKAKTRFSLDTLAIIIFIVTYAA